MHIEDAVRSRRAIKGYDSSFSLTREEKDHLLDLALHAPSAFNLQHVRLVEVSDLQLRTQLREVAWDQAQVTDAAMLVVVCAQLDSWERNAQRVWDGAPEAVQAFGRRHRHLLPRQAPGTARRSHAQLRPAGADPDAGRPRPGLDSCPMDGFDFDAVARLINLPDNHVIGLMVAVGKKAVEPWRAAASCRGKNWSSATASDCPDSPSPVRRPRPGGSVRPAIAGRCRVRAGPETPVPGGTGRGRTAGRTIAGAAIVRSSAPVVAAGRRPGRCTRRCAACR